MIIDEINVNIPRGKITAFMGPSGTGKTTLLKLVGGQLSPSQGEIHFDKRNIHQFTRKQLFQYRQQIGMLFQTGALFTNDNVFDNVAFPLRELTQLSEDFIAKLVFMKLQMVGLRGAQQLMPSELSGGMARRVALARSMILDPQLMMYDEPFTGLDPIGKGVICRLIKRLNDALDMTSIIVSHDVKETMDIADYVYVMANCKIIGEGKPQAVFSDATPAIKQFMQGLSEGVVPFHFPANPYEMDLGVDGD